MRFINKLVRAANTLRRHKEISRKALELRLREANSQNLANFTSELQRRLEDIYNIYVGFYVTGRFTHPNFSPKECPSGIDLIVAAKDKNLLVPYQQLPQGTAIDSSLNPLYNCSLSDNVLAVLKSRDFESEVPNLILPGKREGWLSEEKKKIVINTTPQGMPNKSIYFTNGKPINLAVQYYSPLNFKKKKDGSDQFTFDEAIAHERHLRNSFCPYLPPN